MKKHLFLITGLITSSVVLSQPNITGMSPLGGPIGTNVVLTGTGFATSAAQNVVYFGATKAIVNNATANSLSVTVPLGAIHKPVSALNFTTGLTGYSNNFFNTSFSCGSNLSAASFTSYVPFTLGGGNERTICLGDIDGDGKSEMAVSNRTGGFVSIFRNTSTPGILSAASFAPKQDFNITNPEALAIMDMDGDGKIDLVVCDYTASNVTVFRNLSSVGTLSFAPSVSYPTGNGPFGITTGDVDGDGKPEIITGNYGQGGFSVLRNASTVGNLSFGAFISYAGAGQCRMVELADIDGDGKKDLSVASRQSNVVSVFRNTSTTGTITAASFSPKVDFATPLAGGEGVVASDIDGDGKLDLAVTGLFNSVSILRNTATSGVINAGSFAAPVSYNVGSTSYAIAIGDITGDGKPDAVIPSTGVSFPIFQNVSTIGTVSFSPVVSLASNISSGFESAVGDLDNDGKNDIVRTPITGNDLNVYRNITGVSAVSTSTNVSCNSLCNGGILLSTTAATSSVIWSNSSTSYSLTNLCSGLYNYTLTSGTCIITSSVNVTQPVALTLSLSATNSLICSGNSSTLTSNAAGGTGTLSYVWSNSLTTAGITVSPSVSTIYTVNVLDANACAAIGTIAVNISPNPTVTIVSGNSVVCLGSSETLTANGASTYTWNTGSNSNSISISPTVATVYTVTGSSAAGCTGANNTSTVSMNVVPLPTVSTVSSASLICSGNSATLTASGASTYSWSSGSNSATAVVSPTSNTTYTVTGLTINGCSNISVISQSVSTCAGFKVIAGSNNLLALFPNPNSGVFKLEVSAITLNSQIEIYNNLGQLVYSDKINEMVSDINISQFSNGLYTVKLIQDNNLISTQKLIKQ